MKRKLDNKTYEFFRSAMPYLVELANDEGLIGIDTDNIKEWLEGYLYQSSLTDQDYLTILFLEDVDDGVFKAHIMTKTHRDSVRVGDYVKEFNELFYLITDRYTPEDMVDKYYRIWWGKIDMKAAGKLGLLETINITEDPDYLKENIIELGVLWDKFQES